MGQNHQVWWYFVNLFCALKSEEHASNPQHPRALNSEWRKVTIIFNKSPESLKATKPSKEHNQCHPGALVSWNQVRVVSKVTFISGTVFPCQKGGILPDPVASEKRLKTFLCHHVRTYIIRGRDGQDDDEEVED